MENKYYFSKIINTNFEQALEKITDSLKTEGFGIITEIDIKATMKTKLDKDFRNYKILGACNPSYAFKALSAEDKIGTMLPCNVIVQELDNGAIEVAAVDPVASMQAIQNSSLEPIATEVREKLQRAVQNL